MLQGGGANGRIGDEGDDPHGANTDPLPPVQRKDRVDALRNGAVPRLRDVEVVYEYRPDAVKAVGHVVDPVVVHLPPAPPAAEFIAKDQRANNRALLGFLTPRWKRARLAASFIH